MCFFYLNICRGMYLSRDYLKLLLHPVLMRKAKGLDIAFCPDAHTFAKALQTHLKRWHLERLAHLVLEAILNLLPSEAFLILETEKETILFVHVDIRRWWCRPPGPFGWGRLPVIIAQGVLRSL